MKKFLLCIVAAFSTLSIFAQDNDEVAPYPYTFISVSGGALFPHTDYAEDKYLVTPIGAVSVGHYFNDIIGLRLQAEGWETKGGLKASNYIYSYKHVTGNADIMFNLTSAFSKYVRPIGHTVDVALLVGGGADYRWDVKKKDVAKFDSHYWTHNMNAGLLLSFNVTDYMAFTFEGLAMGYPHEWHNTALAGLTFKFGRHQRQNTHTEPKKADVEPKPMETPDFKPTPVHKPEIEEPQKDVFEVILPEEETINVFFGLASSEISSEEQQKIDNLKKNMSGRKIKSITAKGYADKNTGNAKINRDFATKRAAVVAKALGHQEVTTTSVLGDEVQPFTDNDKNRVVIVNVVYDK